MSVVVITKFSDLLLQLTYRDNGTPLDLSTYTVSIADATFTGLSAAITDAANGVVQVTMDTADTQALEVGAKHHFRVVLNNGSQDSATQRILCEVR